MTLSFVDRAGLLSLPRFCQASWTQIIGPIASEKPAAVLEVTFDELITGMLAGLVAVCLGAPGASGGKTVLGGGSTGTGDLRLELTCDARHLASPMRIVKGSLKSEGLNALSDPFQKKLPKDLQALNAKSAKFQDAVKPCFVQSQQNAWMSDPAKWHGECLVVICFGRISRTVRGCCIPYASAGVGSHSLRL
jgi:hypothetical protein